MLKPTFKKAPALPVNPNIKPKREDFGKDKYKHMSLALSCTSRRKATEQNEDLNVDEQKTEERKQTKEDNPY